LAFAAEPGSAGTRPTPPLTRMMGQRLGNITSNEGGGGCATVLSLLGTVSPRPQNENLAES